MSPPRRRSSRLRNSSGSTTPARKAKGPAASRLTSLVEKEESPSGEPQFNSYMDGTSPATPRTPATAGRIIPSRDEMHPALAHQSTTKKSDEGLALGFIDVKDERNGVLSNTPSKTASFASPSFDFRFARPASQLGPEAQRLREELREEALRIKARLAAEREEDTRVNGENIMVSGRKFAQPKGKVGRFSDVHMAEFKKMDSIAGHPSSFRAQSGRSTPIIDTLKRSQSKAKLDDSTMKDVTSAQPLRSLKRSQSKAQLDDRDVREPAQKSLKRTPSRAQPGINEPDVPVKKTVQKPIQATAPMKRARTEAFEISTNAPANIITNASTKQPGTPSTTRPHSFLESITTPTHASIARTASVKQVSNIPTLSRSPSKPKLTTPGRIIKSSAVSNLGSIARSILRRPSPDKSVLPQAKTPVKLDLNKDLPSIPGTPQFKQGQLTRGLNLTPSPHKSGIPRSKSTATLAAPIEYPKLATKTMSTPQQTIVYPSLNNRPLPQPPKTEIPQPPAPSAPSAFTFRTDQTINVGPAPHGFGSSPGQASLRQVRPSIIPSSMPGSYPVGSDKENSPAKPKFQHGNYVHGVTNKKRHRANESEGDTEDEVERSPKKHKIAHDPVADSSANVPRLQQKLMAEKSASQPTIPSPAKKKGGLSLSRLNMLARPKNRR